MIDIYPGLCGKKRGLAVVMVVVLVWVIVVYPTLKIVFKKMVDMCLSLVSMLHRQSGFVDRPRSQSERVDGRPAIEDNS